MLVHGTAIALGPHGVLVRGPSAAGKSDLAMRLLATPLEGYPALRIPPLGALDLVADDQCELTLRDGIVTMASPATIRGKFEVRGLGLVTLPDRQDVALSLVVDITPTQAIERMPEAATVTLLGIEIPALEVAALEASAPLRVLIALHHRIER